MQYIKAKEWKGQTLNDCVVSLKVDGVRALRVDGKWVSRNGKPLYGLDHLPDKYTDVEVYKNNWSESVSLCRTKDAAPIDEEFVYSLDPLDSRLYLTESRDTRTGLRAVLIEGMLNNAIYHEYEGLVIRSDTGWWKVKNSITFDVKVTGVKEGTGKNKGKLGAFITEMGNVGTGFTDEQRVGYWDVKEDLIGMVIEVKCMELTPENKFRHPRFVRERWDK